MTDKGLFIEEIIINSLKSLLKGRVNELLGETEYPILPIEFGSCRGGSAVAGACSPVIMLSTCERSEKERIIRLDTYSHYNSLITTKKYDRRGFIFNLH
jgi:hypothetical protein